MILGYYNVEGQLLQVSQMYFSVVSPYIYIYLLCDELAELII